MFIVQCEALHTIHNGEPQRSPMEEARRTRLSISSLSAFWFMIGELNATLPHLLLKSHSTANNDFQRKILLLHDYTSLTTHPMSFLSWVLSIPSYT